MRAEHAPRVAQFECYGATDLGRVRRINSDQYLFGDLKRSLSVRGSTMVRGQNRLFGDPKAQLFLVADGIGGESGQRASAVAVEAISDCLMNTLQLQEHYCNGSQSRLFDCLKGAFHSGRERIQRELAAHPDWEEMGTTVTLGIVCWPRLFLCHAGDSRCYLFRGSRLRQLTKDHTFAQRMVDMGILTSERATASRWSNVLWNLIGAGSGTTALEPQLAAHSLIGGDRLLFCTDGVTKQLSDPDMARILEREQSPERACGALIKAAKQAGGWDNITVVVADFPGADGESPSIESDTQDWSHGDQPTLSAVRASDSSRASEVG